MTHDPIIYSGYEDTGYRPRDADKFGLLGDIYAVTFHHSAGPRAYNKARAIELHKAYQRQHINQGYGDIGYHFSLDDHGRFYTLRSLRYKGAHVGDYNTGNVGIMVHGNYEYDELNEAQHASLRWLFTGGFAQMLGEREGDIALVRGHKEWPGHNSNLCPGDDLMDRIRYLRNNEFH
jgi:hypothetical protein